jgi:hypothetical protein
MFDDFESAFDGLGGVFRVPICIPLDEDGYMDRKCPHPSCGHLFKVLFDDWETKIPEEQAFCPLCRHGTERNDFTTPEFDAYVGDVAQNFAAGLIDDAMSQAAQSFNRSQPRGGFIEMSMTYERGHQPIMMPFETEAAMRQKFACEKCDCHYASIGAAFFCHACGHNSARTTFDQTLALVRKNLLAFDSVSEVIGEKFDADMARDFLREFYEGSIGRIVGAFQLLAEAVFDELPNRSQFKPRRNVFQNLSESSDLWEKAGKGRYEDILDSREYNQLVVLFQRRHILEHREGIVDQSYIDNSGDRTYVVGQRLVIVKQDVEVLLLLLEKLGVHIRN